MNIYLDLETIPSTSDAVRAALAAKISPPGSMSKSETIAKWEVESKPAAIDEAVAKTSFDGAYGSICVIGFAFENAEPISMSTANQSEADMLRHFMSVLTATVIGHTRPVFVGHNIHGFDLPFIWKRCVINRVKPSMWIPLNVKAWSERIGDTMLMWDDSRDRRISLGSLCQVLGVPTSKGDLDGSKVAEYWAADRCMEVANYCRDDVVATRACYQRMSFGESA